MPREHYATDLTDEQWLVLEPLIPPPAAGGRKREVDLREVVNAVRHLLATDCGWRELPDCFPNRSTVRHYYDAWRQSGLWERIEVAVGSAAPRRVSPNSQEDEEPPKPGNATS